MRLIQMLNDAGFEARESAPGTVFVSTPCGPVYLSTTARNGGRGYWQGARRVHRKVIPNTLGCGWRQRVVEWLKHNNRRALHRGPA